MLKSRKILIINMWWIGEQAKDENLQLQRKEKPLRAAH